jgi:hypothetical protein
LLGRGSISESALRREGRREAYIANYELVAREEARGIRSTLLAEALNRMRRERGKEALRRCVPSSPA